MSVIKYERSHNIIIPTGEILREEISERGMMQKELAIRLDMSAKAINQIMQGIAPVTVGTAMKLEKVLGIPSSVIMNIENNYQIQRQKKEEMDLAKQDKTVLKNYSVCYSTLAEYKYVKKSRKQTVRVDSLRRFFGVANLLQIDLLERYNVAFRQNNKREIDRYSLACWLRTGEIEAEKLDVVGFSRAELKNVVLRLSKMTKLPTSEYSKKIRELCARAGVKVVYTPYLKNTYVNGAVRWIGKTPVIQLSTRQLFADTLWFTLMHEIAHILKHSKDLFVDFQYVKGNGVEEEADNFAQEVLLNHKVYEKFIANKDFSHKAIMELSNQNGIHEGIIAGRLANDASIPEFTYKEAFRYRCKLQLSTC